MQTLSFSKRSFFGLDILTLKVNRDFAQNWRNLFKKIDAGHSSVHLLLFKAFFKGAIEQKLLIFAGN